jgi:hypothetical protein
MRPANGITHQIRAINALDMFGSLSLVGRNLALALLEPISKS